MGNQYRCLLPLHEAFPLRRKRRASRLARAIAAEIVAQQQQQRRQSVPGGPKDLPTQTHHELAELTSRELQVFHLLRRGHDDHQIAKTLNVSRHTIRNHVASIYLKLGLHRRADVIVWAISHGITGRDQDIQTQQTATLPGGR